MFFAFSKKCVIFAEDKLHSDMSTNTFTYTEAERTESIAILDQLRKKVGDSFLPDDEERLRRHLLDSIAHHQVHRNVFGLNPILCSLQTALIAVEETGLKRDGVLAILLYNSVLNNHRTLDEVNEAFGSGVATIIRGLVRIQELYKKSPTVESENFRNLLLSFAEDMRVILIMIADRVNLMRQIRDTDNEQAKREVSEEAS